jgi:hypothetical protein
MRERTRAVGASLYPALAGETLPRLVFFYDLTELVKPRRPSRLALAVYLEATFHVHDNIINRRPLHRSRHNCRKRKSNQAKMI